MTTEIDKVRAEEIRTLHAEIGGHLRTTLDKAIRIGELLTEQKAGLKHGEWLPWIDANCPFTDRTAREYIRLHERREELKSEMISDLAGARRLLTPPPTKPSIEAARKRAQEAAEEYLRLLADTGEAEAELDDCLCEINVLHQQRPNPEDAEATLAWLDRISANSDRFWKALGIVRPDLREMYQDLSIEELGLLDDLSEWGALMDKIRIR